MAKVLLTKEQLLDLDRTLVEIYAFFREVRTRSVVAQLIHYPSVPAQLAESLVIHCAEHFFGSSWTARLGTKLNDGDIILERPLEQRMVEVKATGQTNFQEFKSKDLAADFLVWIDFGDRYITGSGGLHIYILMNPAVYFRKPLRLKLHDFLSRVEGSVDLVHIQAESVYDLLQDANTDLFSATP